MAKKNREVIPVDPSAKFISKRDKLIAEAAKQYEKPGIYDNVPFEVYLAINAISRSYLCKMLNVPAKAKVADVDTQAMLDGRALHKYNLEGEEAFNETYAIGPEVNLATTIGKQAWTKFEMENSDKKCLRPKDINYEKLKGIRNAIITHPAAWDLLKDGSAEKTIIWRDEETGFLCKARPDKHPSKTDFVIVDYKSTEDASQEGFDRSVRKFFYFIQDGMYSEGMEILTGKKFLFAFVVVEKKPPYRTEVYTLDEDIRRVGRSEFHRLLRVERQCRKQKFWPHYKHAGAVELPATKWFKQQYPEVFPEVL